MKTVHSAQNCLHDTAKQEESLCWYDGPNHGSASSRGQTRSMAQEGSKLISSEEAPAEANHQVIVSNGPSAVLLHGSYRSDCS